MKKKLVNGKREKDHARTFQSQEVKMYKSLPVWATWNKKIPMLQNMAHVKKSLFLFSRLRLYKRALDTFKD